MRPNFRGQRPAWWPAEEPWPPRNSGRHLRGRFFRRIGGLLFLLGVFGLGGCALAFWLGAALAGVLEAPPGMPMMPWMGWRMAAPFVAPLVLAPVVVGVVVIVLALRRSTAPLGDVMEAAERVAAGDYQTRVAERGPTEARALARAFNTMTARLQADDEQRRRLLADVTHELRTPLAVIQGHLEALLDGVHPRDDAHLAAILEETRVLARLIEDLRTLSLAESGALRLQREPTDLEVVAAEAAAAFKLSAEAAGVALRVEAAGELPLLDLDPARLREVLTNLIANALRYTPRGGTVTVRLTPDAGRVGVAVQDTGVGIAPEVLPHIFDRFYKSDESRGMGLGLAIARNLVAAHGGEITAESEPGRGTTIRFTLPVTGPA